MYCLLGHFKESYIPEHIWVAASKHVLFQNEHKKEVIIKNSVL